MARIKLTSPNDYIFDTTLTIRVSDLNYGNHLGNDKVLSLAHQARILFLKSLGYKSELEIEGVGLVMSDAAMEFKSEAFLGDEIKISIGVSDISRVGFDLYYHFENTANKKVVALVKTGIVMFDYQLRKPVMLPERLKMKLKK